MESSASLGERVAFYRRRRGLSQARLGALIGRSESWVSQIERGVRSLDRLSVLKQLAAELRVRVLDLDPNVVSFNDEEDQEPPAVTALRATLIEQPWLTLAPQERPEPRSDLETLTHAVDAAWRHVHDSSYAALSQEVPAVIRGAEGLARAVSPAEAPEVFALVAELYQLLAAALAKLGEPDLGWLAADRSIRAAEMANDRLLAIAGLFRMAHVFVSARRVEQARDISAMAIASLGKPVDGTPLEVWSLWGVLNLVRAIVATREGDALLALETLKSATAAAEHVGYDRNDFHTEFGPTNVALHAVSIAVEIGDAGEALRRAALIDASTLSVERRARFLMDSARAYGQRRQTAPALGALLEAEELAPEQVHSHTMVRELIRDLLRREGRNAPPKLRGLARRTSVLP